MKRTIFWMCAVRDSVNVLIILAGIFMLCLPEAWAEGGAPLVLVLLAMAGCAAIIRYLWGLVCRIEHRVFCLRECLAQHERWEQEAPMREARRREEWRRWFSEQEQEA